MKLFTKNTFRNLALVVLGAAALSACGGAGSCVGCAPVTPAGDVTLKLTAPNQYPAGLSSPITAYLTMTNTSNVNATNLYYAIPDETNHTHVAITVVNGVTNPCVSIPAQTSCTFPVTIAANAQTGSFTVTATPNGNSSQSTVKKLWSSLKSDLGLQAGTLSLTANIGLTDVPANTNSGANGISFLYSSTIAASESGDTLLSIVGVVSSAEAGSFNTINLTDQSGNPLNFSVVSGNSGQGASNFTQGSIVTFLLRVPASATGGTFNFYAQTAENGSLVNQGTTAWPISVGSATAGVLVIQPTNFSLSAPNNESQIVTFTNIGNGAVNSLTIPTPTSPLYMISSNCGSSLAAGVSCTYVLGSHAEAGFSGDAGFTASYNNGSATAYVAAQVHYAGVDPVAGISITSPTLNFVANTENTSVSSQLTLTNSGNVSESDFVFTVPEHFTLSTGTTGTPCVLSGNTVTTILAKATSCTLTLTYTNATLTSQQQLASLLVNYKFHGVAAPQSIIPLTYQTVQASGLLEVTPSIYSYPNIRANGNMSESKVFVYTNIGTGTASSIAVTTLLADTPLFQIIPSSPSAANDCGSSITSLAPGAQCQVTVQFGPTYAEGNGSSPLSASYESMPSTTPVKTDAALSGMVLPANSANIIVSAVGFSPAALGGNGESAATAFAFESSISPISVTLTYKNTGNDAAAHFIVSSSLYTFSTNNCNDVTLPINGTCTVVVNYTNTTTAVDDAISLGSKYIPLSWSDDSGVYSNMGAQWDNNGTPQDSVFISIFAKPSVTAMMSYESSGANPISSVKAESDFYIVYQLTGGYNVGNMIYGVNITAAQGGSPAMSVYLPITCTLSQNQKLCYIKLNAGGVAESQVIGYTTTGSVTPSPATSGNFNVNSLSCNPCSIFVTPELATAGDLVTGANSSPVSATPPVSNGYAGGDAICQYYAGTNSYSGTYKALIAGTNRVPGGSDWVLQASTPYIRASDSVAIATSTESAILPDPLANTIVSNSNPILTGFVYDANPWAFNASSSCQSWTSASNSEFATYADAMSTHTYGNSMTTPMIMGYLVANEIGTVCDNPSLRLYCVQQDNAVHPAMAAGALSYNQTYGACGFTVTGLPAFNNTTSVTAIPLGGSDTTNCTGQSITCTNHGSGNVFCEVAAHPGNYTCSTTVSSSGYSNLATSFNLIACR